MEKNLGEIKKYKKSRKKSSKMQNKNTMMGSRRERTTLGKSKCLTSNSEYFTQLTKDRRRYYGRNNTNTFPSSSHNLYIKEESQEN